MNSINLLENLRDTLSVTGLETVVEYDKGDIPEDALIIACPSEDNDSTMPTPSHTICNVVITAQIDPVGILDIERVRQELLDLLYSDTFLEDLRNANPAFPVYIYGYEFVNDELVYDESTQSYQIGVKFWTSSV